MKIKNLFLIVLFLIINKISLSETPTYTLKVDSMRLTSQVPYVDNVIEFGIYLTHTNSPTPFHYTGQQIFFSFNPNIVSGDPLDSANILKYIKISSQLEANLQPRNPSIGTASNPSAVIMKLLLNPMVADPPNNISGVTNLLIVRMRLWSRAGPFNLTNLSNYI